VELHACRALPCAALPAGAPSHCGRVIYCGTYFGKSGFAVGGEDGKLKTYGLHRGARVAGEEAMLPSSVALKTLSAAHSWESRNSGILLGAGSRLTYAIWHWEEEGQSSEEDRAAARLVLLSSGLISPKHCQDHRMLCSAARATPYGFIVALCDSRGIVTLGSLDQGAGPSMGVCTGSGNGTLQGDSTGEAAVREPNVPHSKTIPALAVHEELDPCNGTPILSCCLLPVTQAAAQSGAPAARLQAVIGVFGASSGDVSIWQLAMPARAEMPVTCSRLLARYSAHSMGANALDAVWWVAPERRDCVQVLVCSGGDDQAITVASGELLLAPAGEHAAPRVSWSTALYAHRYTGAAGSSLEGLILRPPLTSAAAPSANTTTADFSLLSLSADQRVHRWLIQVDKHAELMIPSDGAVVHTTPIAECASAYGARALGGKSCGGAGEDGCAKAQVTLCWQSGCVANVGDPQGLARGTDYGRVAVVGQGVQEFE